MNTIRFRFAVLAILFLGIVPFSARAQSPRTLYDLKMSKYPGSRSGINPGIATGSHSGLYITIGEDMSRLCREFPVSKDQPAFRLNVFATEGGFDSMKRLHYESEVQLAIVQSDLYHFALHAADPEHPLGKQTPANKRALWKQLSDSIRIIAPLYTEKIHVVTRNGGSGADIKTLMDLFTKKSRVNIGTVGSGVMVTCLLLEQAIKSNDRNLPGWDPRYYSTDVALEKLLNDQPGDDGLDAVILVGGVPFPALQRFGSKMALIEQRKRFGILPGKQVTVPALKLVPFGDQADRILNTSKYAYFRPTTIRAGDYDFLTGKSGEIKTRGVTACLVTHNSYGSSSRDSHKIQWVRHIVYRTLTNLDSRNGLIERFGVPRAGVDKWSEMAQILHDINSGTARWNEFGWQRHSDPTLKSMMDVWSTPYRPGSNLIDPDDPYDPY